MSIMETEFKEWWEKFTGENPESNWSHMKDMSEVAFMAGYLSRAEKKPNYMEAKDES